jgi:hypothetical protein
MTQTNRPILKLPSRSAESVDEQVIVLDSIDVLLPCRRFTVSFKVSERGSISPTSEFLLRLLHAADGILEADIERWPRKFGQSDQWNARGLSRR